MCDYLPDHFYSGIPHRLWICRQKDLQCHLRTSKRCKKILANGKSILAEILSSEILDQSNPNQINKKLVVRFNNFSGTPIKFPIYITDTNPQLIRYEKGNSIPIKVDEKVKYAPYVLPDGSTPAVKNRLFFLLSAIWV